MNDRKLPIRSSRLALIPSLAIAALLGIHPCAMAQSTPPAIPAAAVAPTPAASSSSSSSSNANANAKLELAGKLVALQRGPDMERMVFQLTSSAVQPVIAKWAPELESMPKAKVEKAREQLNAELKTLSDATRKLIDTQMSKSADSALLPAYMERFSEEEMGQLLAMFESPIYKKYQRVAPELGNLWVKDVVENTRTAVEDSAKAFDAVATKIVGKKK
jgi:uncharacterized protein